jgi:thiol-disulfide isomerase/thioredoxin
VKKEILFIVVIAILGCNEMKPKDVVRVEPETENQEVILQGEEISPIVRSYDFPELSSFLSKENDTTYIVNFWATWCRPCIKELPAFEKLNSQYRSKKVKVLLVSLDFPDNIESRVIPFMVKNKIESQVVLLDDSDANSWIPKISETWSGAIPATLIYNKRERKFYEQSFSFEELQNQLNKFI